MLSQPIRKRYHTTFLFIDLTTLGTFIEILIGWFKQVERLMIVLNNRIILCVIIGDLHRFIGHCNISLDP